MVGRGFLFLFLFLEMTVLDWALCSRAEHARVAHCLNQDNVDMQRAGVVQPWREQEQTRQPGE